MARCEACDEAFRIFTCLWGQMQLLRLCALLCRSHVTLLEWLSSTGPRASTMLLSFIMCTAVPDEATLVAAVCSSLAASWAALPSDLDCGGAFELLAHINMLTGLAWSLATSRPACEGWAACAPGVRCLFVLVFVLAALARLNRDFHDPRRSAVSVLAVRLADAWGARVGLRPWMVDCIGDQALLGLLRLTILVVEAAGLAVPFLLWCGSVASALAIAWLFCLILVTTSAYDFACLLVAAMPFWVPPERLVALRWLTLSPTARGVGLGAAAALLGPALLQRSGTQRRLRFAALVWILAAGPLSYAGRPLAEPPSAAALSWCGAEVARRVVGAVSGGLVQQVARLTAFLALLNGASPYLGLKTQATWSLLSNLHVEGGVTNHFFVPASTQIFDYTKDCVVVTRTNVPMLQEQHAVEGGTMRLKLLRGFAERAGVEVSVHNTVALCGEMAEEDGDVVVPYCMPYFELRRVISSQALPLLQEFFVEYMHCGAPHRFEVQLGMLMRGSDVRLAEVPAAGLRKFLAFRSLPADGPRGACTY